MKKLLIPLLLASSVYAADLTYTCTKSDTSNCLVTAVVILEHESVKAVTKDNQTFYWCNGWGTEECYLKGTFTILNNEFSIEELGALEVRIYTAQNVLSCFKLFGPYVCSTKF